MAASDPTPYVATPTGTLQGVAAFSWDGSAWQPSASAGPDVATPTGVLRGVAPFSWSGGVWTPAGRAQPGVATPTGVLDGVAVYTWSGSAWTPPYGGPSCSTPSGALRGIAAFSWDGAAWQPAGQAQPSVATPYGVLDGVAFFNWGGSAWQAGGAVPAGATLDLSFLSGTLDPRITFTRASTATYFDSSGVMQTAATNAPRFDYDPVTHALRGLLIEEARTNNLLPSVPSGPNWITNGAVTWPGGSVTIPDGTTSTTSLLAASSTTNSIRALVHNAGVTTLATTAYTITVFLRRAPVANAYIQLNAGGAASAAYYDLTNGTAVVGADLVVGHTNKSVSIVPVGNGWYRVSFTLTTNATAGLLSTFVGPCTVVSASGDNRSAVGVVGQGIYVWGGQVEQGAFPTSYIPTTGAAATRAIDLCAVSSANMAGWFLSPGGSWAAEFIPVNANNTRIIGVAGAGGLLTPLYNNAVAQPSQYDGATALFSSVIVSLGVVTKAASAYSPGTGKMTANGATVASSAMANGYASLATTGIALFTTVVAGSPENTSGYLRRVRYWPRVLSDAEMQSVTT